MDDFSMTGITRHLQDIMAGEFAPIAETDDQDASVRELARVLNELDRDRRQHRAAEQARDRLIIDSTPVAICITNAHGIYEYTNSRYRELTGYSREELVGRHFTLVVPPDAQEELSQLHDEFMGQRYELTGEWTIVSKDGNHIPILANAAYVIDVDGQPKMITFLVDITDVVRVREDLSREVEERRRLEHIRDNVERMLQHDLRNPIDGIRTAAEFLLDDDLGEGPNEFIRLMYDAAGRARSRIDSSMAYTQMEQGSYQIERARLNVVQLVRDVEHDIQELLTAYRTELRSVSHEANLTERYDVEVWGEVDFLQDALTNIVRNAVEAGELGTAETVTIEVREYPEGMQAEYPAPAGGDHAATAAPRRIVAPGPIAFSPVDPVVAIEVRNQADIPVEIRAQLFDPYVTFGKSAGTGLGTYTAMLIARAHGGTIVVDSGGGAGTSVTLLLPRGRVNDVR
jgi:PAS domain S-box-containing protein